MKKQAAEARCFFRVSYSEKPFRCFVCFRFTFPSCPSKYLPSSLPPPHRGRGCGRGRRRVSVMPPVAPREAGPVLPSGEGRGGAPGRFPMTRTANPPPSTSPEHTAQTRKPPAAPRGTETHQTSQETRKDEHPAH